LEFCDKINFEQKFNWSGRKKELKREREGEVVKRWH